MADMKPKNMKAPLGLLPAIALRAVSAAMEHGAIKYEPWNWQDAETDGGTRQEYLSAMARHLFSVIDPSEDDYDEESGLHHLAHLGANVMILLWQLGEDYKPSKLKSTKYSHEEYSLHMPLKKKLLDCGWDDLADLRENTSSDPPVCSRCGTNDRMRYQPMLSSAVGNDVWKCEACCCLQKFGPA